MLDLRTNQISTLPGSEGLFSPRWSPNGRYIAAMTLDELKLMLFDFTTQEWLELASHSIHNPRWSQDGAYVYFQGGKSIFRVRISNHKMERIAGLKDLQRANAFDHRFAGLAPDDSPLVILFLSIQDIYALDWQAP